MLNLTPKLKTESMSAHNCILPARVVLMAILMLCASFAASAQMPQLTLDLGNGVNMELVLIRPGAVAPGPPKPPPFGRSARKQQEATYDMRLRDAFYLGKYEVTQEQWQAVMGNNPSSFKRAKHPVENVSWKDCQAFVKKLQERVSGYRVSLPTDAQWTYACRAGSSTAFCYGDNEAGLGEYAWFLKNYYGSTQPVGGKKSNAWGLYDMHGNVAEWCCELKVDAGGKGVTLGSVDWSSLVEFAESRGYTGSPYVTLGNVHGGSWNCNAQSCRSVSGYKRQADWRANDIGLRVCCVQTAAAKTAPDRKTQPAPKPTERWFGGVGADGQGTTTTPRDVTQQPGEFCKELAFIPYQCPEGINFSGRPAWSPDGKTVLFSVAIRRGHSDEALFAIELSSSNILPWTFPKGMHPAFSADGQKVIFSHFPAAGFSVVDVVKGQEQRCLDFTGWMPSFAPDGRRFCFMSHRSGHPDVWVANADGANPEQLTDTKSWENHVDVSPAEDLVAYSSYSTHGISVQQITTRTVMLNTDVGRLPKWSPDGQMISFPHSNNIWVMDKQGKARLQIMNEAQGKWQGGPAWSPGGTRMICYFAGERGNGFKIVSLDLKAIREKLGVPALGASAKEGPEFEPVIPKTPPKPGF